MSGAPSPQCLFVLGMDKTGTSTLVSMVNAHPDIYVLFEVNFRKAVSDIGRNEQLVESFAPADALFNDTNDDVGVPYLQFAELVETEKRATYQWIGAKIPGAQRDILERIGQHAVIACVRDVTTWSAKNKVIFDRYPNQDMSIVPAVTDYVRYFIELYSLPNRLIVRLEDMITQTQVCIDRVSSFLGLQDDRDQFQAWWTKHDYAPGHPKRMVDWYSHHRSAFAPPVAFDTKVTLSEHPFWAELLPVFQRYYDATNQSNGVTQDQIAEDLKHLDDIERRYAVAAKDAFDSFKSWSIKGYTQHDDGRVDILLNEHNRVRKKARPPGASG